MNLSGHQQGAPIVTAADQERRRQWAEAVDRVWGEMQIEPDWAKRWEIMCGNRTTYTMCVELDSMAERRWGADWAHTRQVERAVALEAIRKVNATYWKGAA